MQNLNWLVLQQWHKEFGKFFTRELESLKIGTLMGFVIQSRKCLSSTFLGDLSVMTMKNDAKLQKELTCHFKIDMDQNMFELKKYTGVWLIVLQIQSEFEVKLTIAFKNHMKNLEIFRSQAKKERFHFRK